jgi:hypothetical protein
MCLADDLQVQSTHVDIVRFYWWLSTHANSHSNSLSQIQWEIVQSSLNFNSTTLLCRPCNKEALFALKLVRQSSRWSILDILLKLKAFIAL